LVAGKQTLAQGGTGLKLSPGDHQHLVARFTAPAVRGSLSCAFRVTIEADGQRRFSDERPFTVYAPTKLPRPARTVYLYDPAGKTLEVLRKQGLKVVSLASLSTLPEEAQGVLILGEGALSSDAWSDPWKSFAVGRRLMNFVRGGGRVIVLRQTTYPASVLPFHVDGKARSTMAFVQMPHHPLVAGLPDDAFKFWQPDHIVTAGEILRTNGVGLRPLVVTGHADGISHCALAEAPRGKGLYLLCQMPVLERLKVEPMAGELLSRLLTRADEYDAEAAPVAVLGGDQAYDQALAAMGLVYRHSKGEGALAGQAGPVLLRGDVSLDLNKLTAWVKNGGRLLLDRPTASVVQRLGTEAGLKLDVDDFAGPVVRAPGGDPLVEAVTREDLYWLGERPKGPFWVNQPLEMGTCEGSVAIDLDFEPLVTLEPPDLQIDGYIVQRKADQILMATVGSATGTFAVPREGNYLIAVEARGTRCEGQYAMASVTVDGEVLGVMGTGPDWRRRTVPAHLRAGEHHVTVAFINDRSTDQEDRNFFLRSVAVGPAPQEAARVVRIATGPAVAALRLGKGVVVFNFLKWDEERRNAAKASRFFSSLLMALGADFTDQFGVNYDITAFEPMKDLAHYNVRDGWVSLGSSGWISGKVSVPDTGEYWLRVEAAGTQAAGEYPEIVLALDDKEVASFHLTSEDWRWYAHRATITTGEHTLKIMFTNDYYKPPEDRNLQLGGLMLIPAD
ncbi:MAG: hypothetical protein J7M26_00865, partial [Armatimonadetes bacterium]|nr:hypothetical protein [Armatimonadota bacterium]